MNKKVSRLILCWRGWHYCTYTLVCSFVLSVFLTIIGTREKERQREKAKKSGYALLFSLSPFFSSFLSKHISIVHIYIYVLCLCLSFFFMIIIDLIEHVDDKAKQIWHW